MFNMADKLTESIDLKKIRDPIVAATFPQE
jgi:hypothetical protein